MSTKLVKNLSENTPSNATLTKKYIRKPEINKINSDKVNSNSDNTTVVNIKENTPKIYHTRSHSKALLTKENNTDNNNEIDNNELDNNETFGMTVEKTLCDIFNLDNDINLSRINKNTKNELYELLRTFLEDKKIDLTKYIGKGGYKDDFLFGEDKTLQVKTNINASCKVCPPQIGQCTRETFINNVAKKINSKDEIELDTDLKIKTFIINNIKQILCLYINAYYTSDCILYIKKNNKKTTKYVIEIYEKKIFSENSLNNLFDRCKFTFTRNIDTWNESSSVSIMVDDKKYAIGEFQIHHRRNNVKFRFNMNNFHIFINKINS